MGERLNVGCGPHYAPDWLNTDLVKVEGYIEPDLVVDYSDPFPFDPCTFERAYVGHVLEHVPWDDLPAWLDDLSSVMIPDSPVMFVGPDAYRAIEGYKAGTASWHDVAIIIEERSAYTAETGFANAPRWEADRHHWNCHERRVVELLAGCGWMDIRPYGVLLDGILPELPGWPVVSRASLQFAVQARVP